MTESEIRQGTDMPKNICPDDTSFFIIREIPDIDHHLSESKAQKFIDLAADNKKDEEAQQLLSELKDQKVPAVVSKSNLLQVCPQTQIYEKYIIILFVYILFCRQIFTGKQVEHAFLLIQ